MKKFQTNSYWEKFVLPIVGNRSNKEFDIIIAGCGFMGLWSAFLIKQSQPKLTILVVDVQDIPQGASLRNAGFSCFGSVSELVSNEKLMGQDNMLYLAKQRFEGLKLIQNYFQDIDYQMTGGFELVEKSRFNISDLTKLNQLFKSITLDEHTFQIEDKNVFNDSNYYQIKNKFEGVLNSGKLWSALKDSCLDLGVQFESNFHVKNIKELDGCVQVVSTQNISFQCQKFLACTNAFTPSIIDDVDIQPARNMILMTKPFSRIDLDGGYHMHDGYVYFRSIDNRLLIGGGRHLDFETEHTNEEFFNHQIESFLISILQKLVPHEKIRIDLKWIGIMGFNSSKVSAIQKQSDKVYILAPLNGMGVALAPSIANQMVKMI